VCESGWLGAACDIPALAPRDGSTCTSGVVDVAGVCCDGAFVINGTGHCCGAGFAAIDAAGRCCISDAEIDACGVCGGDGVAVDVQGACCSSPLPANGVCCVDEAGHPRAVDECGVCGGVNVCDATVTLRLTSPTSFNETTAMLAAHSLASLFGVPLAAISNISMLGDSNAGARRVLVRMTIALRLLSSRVIRVGHVRFSGG
jgi:hypothetical protein